MRTVWRLLITSQLLHPPEHSDDPLNAPVLQRIRPVSDVAALRECGVPEEPHVVDVLQHAIESSLVAEQKPGSLVERTAAIYLEAERPEALSPVVVQQSVDAPALKVPPELAREPRDGRAPGNQPPFNR